MAIYPYKCGKCGATQEVVQSIASYSKVPIRPHHCDTEMDRVFTVPMVSPDTLWNNGFRSHVDGSVITSRTKLREHNARNGVVYYDDVASDIPKRRAEAAKKATADIKADLVESLHKVDAGYKPRVEVAGGDATNVDVLEGVA